jgi:hypothetical protein
MTIATPRHVHLLLQMLGVTIALMAVVTLPVCHVDAFAPVTDADALTITENRSITEIVTTPGLHILHEGYKLVDWCETCGKIGDTQPFDGPHQSHAGDIFQRSATMPATIVLDVLPAPAYQALQVDPVPMRNTVPESPPPQIAA